MATRIYAVNPGQTGKDVIEAVGPTATSAIIALVVDLASNVTDGSGTRGPNRTEVLNALEYLKEYILRDNSWPPA